MFERLINRFHPRAPRSVYGPLRDRGFESDIRSAASTGLHRPAQSSVDYEVLDTEQEVGFDVSGAVPVTLEDYLLDVDREKLLRSSSRERLLVRVDQGRILGPDGYLVTRDGMLIEEALPNGYGQRHGRHSVFSRRRFPRMEKLSGRYLHLGQPHGSNYFCWSFEALPLLRFVNIDQYDGVLVPSLKRFHRDSLMQCGVDLNRCIELNHSSYLAVDELQFSTHIRAVPATSWVPDWLKSLFLPIEQTGGRRLYLSRAGASWRGVENEFEVEQLVARYGFEVVDFSNYSVQEQARMIGAASDVISLHGAALTNLAFARPGTRVLEMFPARWTPLTFTAISLMSGLQYSYLNSEEIGESIYSTEENKRYVPDSRSAQGASVSIPLRKLESYLVSVLSAST